MSSWLNRSLRKSIARRLGGGTIQMLFSLWTSIPIQTTTSWLKDPSVYELDGCKERIRPQMMKTMSL